MDQNLRILWVLWEIKWCSLKKITRPVIPNTIYGKNCYNRSVLSHYISQKLHSGKSASLKGLGHHRRNCDFHYTNPMKNRIAPFQFEIFQWSPLSLPGSQYSSTKDHGSFFWCFHKLLSHNPPFLKPKKSYQDCGKRLRLSLLKIIESLDPVRG